LPLFVTLLVASGDFARTVFSTIDSLNNAALFGRGRNGDIGSSQTIRTKGENPGEKIAPVQGDIAALCASSC
jgi:hypothetical protein